VELYRHKNSEKHLFLFTISFIVSVFAIRIFLELTNYMQLGGGGLHIAHVLWGGLSMLIAGISLIVYQGERIYVVSSILLGIGFGFFIDEIGKFITTDNNYFFAPAAAIIYAFMIISFLLAYYYRRQKKFKVKEEMISVLEEMKDVVGGNFHVNQKNELLERIEYLKQNAVETNIKNLAGDIDELIRSDQFKIKGPPKFTVDAFFFKLEKKIQQFFIRTRIAEMTIPYYLLVKAITTISGILIINYTYFVEQNTIGTEISPIHFGTGQGILIIYSVLSFVYVLMLVYSFYLLKTNVILGLKIARTSQLYSILLLNVFAFYFEQFSAATEVSFDIASVYLINIIYKKIKILED
jgi:hypothetical protein